MASPHAQSALILEVPEAEPAVQRLRERLDASALLGVPAHITVLAPFIPADAIDAAVLGQLDRLFAAVSRFRFRLDHTGWFSVEVLWLGPQEPGTRQSRSCGLKQLQCPLRIAGVVTVGSGDVDVAVQAQKADGQVAQ